MSRINQDIRDKRKLRLNKNEEQKIIKFSYVF